MEVRPNGSSIFIIQRLFTKSKFKSRAQHDCVPEFYVISHTVPVPVCVKMEGGCCRGLRGRPLWNCFTTHAEPVKRLLSIGPDFSQVVNLSGLEGDAGFRLFSTAINFVRTNLEVGIAARGDGYIQIRAISHDTFH